MKIRVFVVLLAASAPWLVEAQTLPPAVQGPVNQATGTLGLGPSEPPPPSSSAKVKPGANPEENSEELQGTGGETPCEVIARDTQGHMSPKLRQLSHC